MKKLRALIGWFVFYGGLLTTGVFFVVADPWGMTGVAPGIHRPMVGGDQRYWYAGLLARSKSDSLIVGNSTVILLDPAHLSDEIGSNFINVALTDGTPWENFQLVAWHLRSATPKHIVFGVDHTWCWDVESPDERVTSRMPSWLYEPPNRSKAAAFFSRGHASYAASVVRGWLGEAPRFRADGYFDFLTEYGEYDAERSLALLWPGGVGVVRAAVSAPVSDEVRRSWRFSELARIEAALSAIPEKTSLIFVVPPHHTATRLREGSAAHQRFAACQDEVRKLAVGRDAILIDFNLNSDIAKTDEWWWDPQHYRHNVADMLVESIGRAYRKRSDDPAGRYHIVWDHRREDARTSLSSVDRQPRPAERTGSQ